SAAVPTVTQAATAAVALSSIFSAASAAQQAQQARPQMVTPAVQLGPQPVPPAPRPVAPGSQAVVMQPSSPPATRLPSSVDPTKLKIEIMRLEGLVKKLQAELEAEREYSRALEAHVKTLQEAE